MRKNFILHVYVFYFNNNELLLIIYLVTQDYIGANGIHIRVATFKGQQLPYIGRKYYPTQNIMATCDFDMWFIFVLPGWEKSAPETRIFYTTIPNESKRFLMLRRD